VHFVDPDESNDDKIVPADEIVKEYRQIVQELSILRNMFLKAVASSDEKNARAYSASLKDYRSI